MGRCPRKPVTGFGKWCDELPFVLGNYLTGVMNRGIRCDEQSKISDEKHKALFASSMVPQCYLFGTSDSEVSKRRY